jgi:hypothetical protein
LKGASSIPPSFRCRLSFPRRRQFHARTPGFGKPDGDSLFGGTSAVLPAADVVYLLTDEFPGLSGRGLPLFLASACSFERLFFWHICLLFPKSGMRHVAEVPLTRTSPEMPGL